MRTSNTQYYREIARMTEAIFSKWKPILMYDFYDRTNWTIEKGVRYHIDTDGTKSILSVGKGPHMPAYEPVTVEDLQYILQHGQSKEYTNYLKRHDEAAVAERKAKRKKTTKVNKA